MRANQYNYIYFDITDAQGKSRSEEIQKPAERVFQLNMIDETLTNYVRPEFINRRKLLYSAYFPEPGIYKAFFTFKFANQIQQAAFVIEVEPSEVVEE